MLRDSGNTCYAFALNVGIDSKQRTGLSTQGRLGFLLKHTDVALAAMVVMVVAMMILPLPTWLLDILIATNIAMGVTLLLAVLYVTEPLAIATFPTILLLTTLFRLALNISSTRLILLQADAGRIIDAFGNFVVQGNTVVGGVIFLILTLVQFIVIAKGSERVAEVAARFTLDAMPGKQMSIDADVRSGLIDSARARELRRKLERESQFYGAMDGAMKFVKGDAIAGICITAVNIIAGLVVGVWQMDMSATEALRTYTVLTIGDGLVSQIPALVLSTSAGFLITRVASEEAGSHLGAEVGRQLLAEPRALKITSVLLVGLGLVPGMPTGPFVLLGLVMGFVAFTLDRGAGLKVAVKSLARRARGERDRAPEPARAKEPGPLLSPIVLDVSESIAGKGEGAEELRREVPALRERLFEELGLKLPAVRVRVGEPAGADFAVLVNEVRAASGRVPAGRVFCCMDPVQLRDGGLDVLEGPDPVSGRQGGWIDATLEGRAAAFGCRVQSPAGYVASFMEQTAREHAGELVGVQQVQDLLDALEVTDPALVRTSVPKPVELRLLADVCSRLVEEGVSLRHMARILGTMARWTATQRDPVALTELVRAALSRPISARHAGADGRGIDVFVVSTPVEEAIRASVHATEQGSFLALDPEIGRDIIEAVGREVRGFPVTSTRVPVLVTQSDVRRFLRRLIDVDHPRVAVLSYQEIDPSFTIHPVGEIRVGASRVG